MEIIKTTLDEVTEVVYSTLSSQNESLIYCIADEPCAVVGSNGGANLQAIQKLGIKKVQIKHEGGTIVLGAGDIDIGIFAEREKSENIKKTIINTLVEYLQTKNLNACVVDNDILVNGNKVCGFGSRMFDNILYSAIHIAINVDLDLIKSICTKPMRKTPQGLNEYNISTSDILYLLKEIFNN